MILWQGPTKRKNRTICGRALAGPLLGHHSGDHRDGCRPERDATAFRSWPIRRWVNGRAKCYGAEWDRLSIRAEFRLPQDPHSTQGRPKAALGNERRWAVGTSTTAVNFSETEKLTR